ncbi:hypothetical protein FOA52_013064 [Chlamydomonas sp. UWO 241]|nr:hypothetical protein FOA52_013064 [Chlamydomonas sp. UWO 241]
MGQLGASVSWRTLRLGAAGYSGRAIADKLSVHSATVRSALDRQRWGLPLLPPSNKGMRYVNRQLRPGDLQLLRQLLERDDELYLDDLQALMRRATGRSFSYRAIKHSLRVDLGFTRKVAASPPAPVLYTAI